MNGSMTVATMLFTLRVILLAMVAVVVGMLVVILFVVRPGSDPGIVRAIHVAFAGLVVAELVAWTVVRRTLIAKLRQGVAAGGAEEAEPRLVSGFFTLNLIGAAMIEGASMFAAASHMISGSRPALGAAAGGIVLLLARLPTRNGYRAFVERITGQRPA